MVETTVYQELIHAHHIIRNALQLMTIEQKTEWAKLNEATGCIGEGVTRANERLAVLMDAGMSVQVIG